MITVRDLTFTYAGTSRPAIQNLSFSVGSGEIFGCLGPSGAGKSTTQKVLIRLLKDFEGTVSVLGRNLRSWGSDYYEQIGVSFELPSHYSKLTGAENLRYFGALYRERAIPPAELLEMVGLAEQANVPVAQYSKGMKNRLSIARALGHRPQLLFLDEPTAGLDPVSRRRISNLIRAEKAAGRTVFLTTHDMALAGDLCDRVAFIVDGQISLVDAPHELRLRHGRREIRVEYIETGRTVTRDFPLDGLGENAGFVRILREREIQTIHTLEATLETVFIAVTGRTLE